MNRIAKHLKKEIEQKVESYAAKAGSAAGWGLGFFVFLMVVREGAELALILRAVELSTEGLQTWIGTIVGIGAAVAVGLFFFKGTLKVPLHRFFAVTSWILMLVAVQLAVTGLHELSEARWLPSSKTEMAVLGPIVANELFFFVFVFGAATLMIFREWQSASHNKATTAVTSDAERRLIESQNRRQRRWMIAAASMSLAVILALTADFIYAKVNSAPPQARAVEAVNDIVKVPVSEVQDGNLHLFTLKANGQTIRFMVIKKPNGYGYRSGCLPDLRGRRLSPGRPERHLPALRFGDLYSLDRREGRMQSHRFHVAGSRRQRGHRCLVGDESCGRDSAIGDLARSPIRINKCSFDS